MIKLIIVKKKEIPASSTSGYPAVQLSWSPTQKVHNRITACHVQQSINCGQSRNHLRETELTCSWVVVVPTTNKFVAFANGAEGTVLAGQEYSFFVTVHFSLPFLVFENGAVLRAGTVNRCY